MNELKTSQLGEGKKVIFIDVENCNNYQLEGKPSDYAAIYIACRLDAKYPILEQVKGIPHAFVHQFSEAGKDKADNFLTFLLLHALERFETHPFILKTNDKGLRAKFQRLCHKTDSKLICLPFKFYQDYIGIIEYELTKEKKRNRPSNIIDINLFIQDIFDDLEVYHLYAPIMLKWMITEGKVVSTDNFITYNF